MRAHILLQHMYKKIKMYIIYKTAALTLLALFWLVRFSLCVRPWTDILLVSVLKGQNILGVRKEGKKKDVLAEDMSVVLLRSELLQQQKRSK